MTKTDRDPQDDSLVELDPSQAEAFLERTRTVSDGEPLPPSIPGFEVLGVLGRVTLPASTTNKAARQSP